MPTNSSATKSRAVLASFLLAVLALVMVFSSVSVADSSQDVLSKIDPQLLNPESSSDSSEYLVILTEQADLSASASLKTKEEKGGFVYRTLVEISEKSQEPIVDFLESSAVSYRSFWVANMLLVQSEFDILLSLAERSDVSRIAANPRIQFSLPTPTPSLSSEIESPPWNISAINADDLWALGMTGTDVVIGGQDTGYDWDHPALIDQYRGWNGSMVNHNYNWHDAIHSGGSVSCEADSQVPCDDNSHGTHTMGTMVGDGGPGYKIGVAPGAKWIGCRNMDRGVGTPATYAECYEWFIAPTDLDGQNPDPSLAPDIINNSWSCPVYEGCTDPDILKTVVENVRSAGILTVHSAGNSGSSCSTVNTPAAIYEASFTVGAVDQTGAIAIFSSRGPVTVDGSGRLKPDVSAPGVGILSSVPNGLYSSKMGTSMAAPHVAGAAALLLSAHPSLKGHPDQIELAIEDTTEPRTSSQSCGGILGSQIPNNTFGHGLIDAAKPYLAIRPSAAERFNNVNQPQTLSLDISLSPVVSRAVDLQITTTIPLGTSLISATAPYTATDSQISWSVPVLNSEDSISLQLVVLAEESLGELVFSNFQATSHELSSYVIIGPSMIVLPRGYFVPFINN